MSKVDEGVFPLALKVSTIRNPDIAEYSLLLGGELIAGPIWRNAKLQKGIVLTELLKGVTLP
jgi:hypothetical protein